MIIAKKTNDYTVYFINTIFEHVKYINLVIAHSMQTNKHVNHTYSPYWFKLKLCLCYFSFSCIYILFVYADNELEYVQLYRDLLGVQM